MDERFPKLSKFITFMADNWHWILGGIGMVLIAWSGFMLESASPDNTLLEKIKVGCKELYNELNNKQYKNGKYILMLGIVLEITALIFSKLSETSKTKLIAQSLGEQNNLHNKIKTLSEEKIALEDSMAKAAKDYYELLNYKVAKIAIEKLNLAETDRISVYRHNKQEKAFQMVARYSKSPVYNNPGRKIYKDNQGFIGIGWKNGKFMKSGFAKYDDSNKNIYVDNIKNECSIPKEVLLNLKMKSSCFYINTIKDTLNHHSVAVIVIESVKPTGLNFSTIDSIIKDVSKDIQTDLEALKRLEPSLTIAKTIGL